MKVKVALMGDICLPLPISMTTHDGVPPPTLPPLFPPATPLPCVEAPTPMMWPPGLALQQNKLTSTVFHKFQFIALDGHDCGHVIPHVTIPPANLKLPVIIMFSSRKVMFSASKVKANGTSVGCACIFTFAMPTPMLCCAFPVSMPIAFPPLNVLHTVTVGMTWADWFAGAIACYLTMAVDAICNYVPFFGKNPFSDMVGGLLGGGSLAQLGLKAVLGIAIGAEKMLLTGEGTIQVGVGSGFAGVQISVGKTQEGNWNAGAQVNTAVPMLPVSAQGAYQHTWNADGTSSDQVTGSVGTPVGTASKQRTVERDKSGNVTKTTTQTTETGGVAVPIGPTSATAAGTNQTTTTQTAGQGPQTTTGSYGGVHTPVGGWGSSL